MWVHVISLTGVDPDVRQRGVPDGCKVAVGAGQDGELPFCTERKALNNCMLERAIPECVSITSGLEICWRFAGFEQYLLNFYTVPWVGVHIASYTYELAQDQVIILVPHV